MGDLYGEGTPAISANPIKHIAHIPCYCVERRRLYYHEFISKASINMIIIYESFPLLLIDSFLKSAFLIYEESKINVND